MLTLPKTKSTTNGKTRDINAFSMESFAGGDKKRMFRRLLSILPDKKCTCKDCEKSFFMNRATIHRSKKEYNGPFCGWCGKAIFGDKK